MPGSEQGEQKYSPPANIAHLIQEESVTSAVSVQSLGDKGLWGRNGAQQGVH